MNSRNQSTRDDDDFIGLAMERFRRAAEAEARIREESLDDLKFAAGDQWPDGIKNSRFQDGRPCLTVNRLPQIIQQITNEQRQQRPTSQVDPVGDGADKEVAQIIEGIDRHIAAASYEDVAVDTAFEHMVRMGWGYLRYVTEYCSPTSMDQEVKAKRVLNPFSIYFDPACQEPDYSDAEYAFVVEDLSRAEYKRRFPKSTMAGLDNFSSIGDNALDWATLDGIRIAEYWHVRHETKTVCRLADGTSGYKDKLPKGADIVGEREADCRTVCWSLINAIEELETKDYLGRWIPIVPVLGNDLIIDGERRLVGVVRYAKDPQRMYNYWVSAQTEMIALAPKSPWVIAEGQIEGYEKDYANANTRNISVLQYRPITLGGVPVAPPMRQTVSPPIDAISVAIQQAALDLKSVTGLYDASLGAPGPERSAKAILARKTEGDVANLHLSDNLLRSMRFAGRVKLDLICKYYDGARIQRIIDPDGSARLVQLNQEFEEQGIKKIYDLTVGDYDVVLSAGPSDSTKRKTAVESMLQLVESCPEILPAIGDLLVQQMDWPGADAVAERLKRALPPALQDPKDGEQAVPQAAQQQLSALGQQNQQLATTVQQLTQVIQTKKLELDSKERIAAIQAQVALITVEATINAKNAQTLLGAEMEALRNKFDASIQAGLQNSQNAHEAGIENMNIQADQLSQQLAQKATQGQQDTQNAHDAGQQALQNQHAAGQQTEKLGAAAQQQETALTAAQQQAAAAPKAA